MPAKDMAKYMRERRERERKTVEQNTAKIDDITSAKIEEMAFDSFDDMQYSWCVEDRMIAGDSEEGAKAYCDKSRDITRRMIAADLEDEATREAAKAVVEQTIIEDSVKTSPFNKRIAEDFENTVQYCVKKRTFYLGSLYNADAIEQFCREMLSKIDRLVRGSIIRQQMREAGEYSVGDVSQEYADRVYSLQAILGVPQATVERFVKADMVSEGKFADLTKRTYNRVSVGDLFGKTRAQILAETFPEQSHYGKDATAREEFQRVEDEQRGKGVRLPGDPTPLPKGGRATVGNLYGKTRKEIRDMGGDH